MVFDQILFSKSSSRYKSAFSYLLSIKLYCKITLFRGNPAKNLHFFGGILTKKLHFFGGILRKYYTFSGEYYKKITLFRGNGFLYFIRNYIKKTQFRKQNNLSSVGLQVKKSVWKHLFWGEKSVSKHYLHLKLLYVILM